MRRENEVELAGVNVGVGLPLHAQGKLFQHVVVNPYLRITPACAGKTILFVTTFLTA